MFMTRASAASLILLTALTACEQISWPFDGRNKPGITVTLEINTEALNTSSWNRFLRAWPMPYVWRRLKLPTWNMVWSATRRASALLTPLIWRARLRQYNHLAGALIGAMKL